MEEGKATGYPLGYGSYGGIEPVRVVGNDDDGDEDDDSVGDGGPPGAVDKAGKGFLCTAVSQKFSWAITEWGTFYSNLIACNETFV